MKTVLLVRHAKSSWKDPGLKDFDRPLNKRGKRDAPFMGKALKERRIHPDLILSSPAKRARQTARVIAEAIGYPKKKIVFDEAIHHAPARALLELVRKQGDANRTIMLFGHNPGFNDLADILLKDGTARKMPTTGVYCIRFGVARWREVKEGTGALDFFDYPKRYEAEAT
ncbi:MAG: phosphohistidine phosphatase SixA [Actinobacteria bacterium]|nr:phosphohistidine phosphatase SixA [Actinomycetota bacterium]